MDPRESSVTGWPPLHNHHNNPPSQFNNYLQNYYNNYYYYHHIHTSPKCPVHNSLIQPHAHHHPSCPHHSLSPPSTQPLMTQGDNDQAIFEEGEEEEEPVFVLTDEWSDFFAKSDAKRKAVKKRAKKKEKTIRES